METLCGKLQRKTESEKCGDEVKPQSELRRRQEDRVEGFVSSVERNDGSVVTDRLVCNDSGAGREREERWARLKERREP